MAAETESSGLWTPIVLSLLLGWAVLAVAFAITSWILDGMEVSGGFGGYLWVSLVFGLVNAILGTILRILTSRWCSSRSGCSP